MESLSKAPLKHRKKSTEQPVVSKLQNKEIRMAIASETQYHLLLEDKIYNSKQQEMALMKKVASHEQRLKTLHNDYQSLKERSGLKDQLISSLRKQLATSLDAIDIIQCSDNRSSPPPNRPSLPADSVRPQLMRDASPKRDSEIPTGSEAAEAENVKESEVTSIVNVVLQSPAMPVLMEERSQGVSEEEHEKSVPDITNDILNVESAKLDLLKCAESSDSDDSETGSEHSESGNSDMNDDITENLTKLDTISEENPQDNVDVDRVEKNTGMSDQILQNISLGTGESPEKTVNIQKHFQVRSKTKQPSGHGDKRKRCEDSTNKSTFDFLSCSSDSFVQDTNKRIKLNCTRNLSRPQLKETAKERHSQLTTTSNDENLEPTRRTTRQRTAGPVSYAEPRLNSKLRRGDKISDDSLFLTLTPTKKKSRERKISKGKLRTESKIAE